MWFNVCGASLDNCSNVGCVDIFLTSVVSLLIACIVFVFFGELVLFQGIAMGFKNKIMLHCYRKVKYQQIQEFDRRYIIF